MQALKQVADWPVRNAAAAVLARAQDGSVRRVGEIGDPAARFPLASVSKPVSAYAALVALEEGAFALDDPAGPPGSTVAHLLAHASGLAFSEPGVLARPGTRRIYSNTGFEELGRALEAATGIGFAEYLAEAVLAPLGMTSSALESSPAYGVSSTLDDMAAFAAELLRPTLLAPETFTAATTVAFRGLDGVLPGFGMQRPNDWGLGFELRGRKTPHWTGSANSPATFGHFGRSGTFLWVDPAAGAACVCLTDRDFGSWAAEAWPPLSDAVLAELPPR
ncbi:beta-lactamase family protein [Frankia sp. CNm7]|uniref:Beta-lactamase family protein n=1 Tax=Frankia nepalensis TaxID=1836974 RepID=A0A937UPG3_9ACTN|nr:serine hydrolase domain-containing protein [Frankia nepalensis]MBL7499189.1 beta-lactamase family protein [Frankia nepalensis]MBL7514753.1 beta-lactamase family protein [Frankia nepalensis]MBL7524022.1 beta-lactamase family protein [Frankia nepalensis]MBL7627240.1 beta-lactamase family protein [Frankia nepalensis]